MITQKNIDEVEAMKQICEKLGQEGEKVLALWYECEAKETPEAKIVKQIDKLQAVEKAYEYESNSEGIVTAWEFIEGIEKRKQIIDGVLLERMSKIKDKCKKSIE